MAMPKARGRIYQVAGREYAVAISAGELDEENNVRLRISIQAHFGNRTFCLVRGVTNRSFWHDYPNIEAMTKVSISLTPSVACGLIVLAHSTGWDPEASKSNFELIATRATIRATGEQRSTIDPLNQLTAKE